MTTNDTPHTVAAVDLGSNSFHMVVARGAHGQLDIRDRLRVRVGLAEGLKKNGHLSRPVRERALDCLGQFGQRLREMPSGSVRAVGTNTLRRLTDDGRFLARSREALGHPIEVIDGREEARLVYLGVAHSSPDHSGQRLVVDIGGGSTECIIGRQFEPIAMDSLYMGCVEYTRRFFPAGKVTAKSFDRAVVAALLELRAIRRLYRDMGWEHCFGSSGTIRAVSSILREQGWTDGDVTPEGLQRLQEKLLRIRHFDRLELPGMAADRAPVLAGGLAVLTGVFQSLRITSMRAADGALREGLLYDLVGRIWHEDVRDRTIRAFCDRFRVDIGHAERVQKTALMLFEQVHKPWEIDATKGRTLLRWVARLHEIGLTVSYRGYHRHGAYLVENSDMPGFSRDDKQNLALIIRCHRRKVDTELFGPLSRARAIMRLCALFRIAVRLHRGRGERSLPDIRLTSDNGSLTMRFPDTWFADHALTLAALRDEVKRLKPLGTALKIT